MQSTNGPPVSMKATGGELVSVQYMDFRRPATGRAPKPAPVPLALRSAFRAEESNQQLSRPAAAV